jgi:tetratricopeptide (TPR) repeat protein
VTSVVRRQVYPASWKIGQDVRVTRVMTSWVAAMVLLAGPSPLAQQAAGTTQDAVVIEGLSLLNRAMLAIPPDAARVSAAIDRLDTGLSGLAPRPDLPGDQTAEVPMLPLAAYADGFARLRRGDFRGGVQSLRLAAAAGTDERAALAAAGGLVQQLRHDEAEGALRAIVAAFPQSGIAHWLLARVYDTLNRISEARAEYEAAAPVALTGGATLYAAIGRLSRLEGRFDRAAEAFAQRVRLVPTDAGAHKDLAWIHLEQDRREEALSAYETARQLDPKDGATYAAIGQIHLDAGRVAAAVAALGRAIELMPETHQPRYAYALALKLAGQTEAAARQMETFERAERQAVADRRRQIATDVDTEDAARRGRTR